MEKGVAFMTNVDEARVEAWHELADTRIIDVTHIEASLKLLLLVFHEALVLGEGYGYLLGLYIYDNFTGHEIYNFTILQFHNL